MPDSSGPIGDFESAEGWTEVEDDLGTSVVIAELLGLSSATPSMRDVSGIVDGTLFASSPACKFMGGKNSARSSVLDDNGDVVLLRRLDALSELARDVLRL